MDVVPIRVKIGLKSNGHADHPSWRLLPLIAAATGPSPTAQQIDDEVGKHTLGGWLYDATSGHEDDTADSPRGQQWGMLLVSRAFANDALATFPTLVTEMTQSECAQFWNNRAMVRLSDEVENSTMLLAVWARRQLMVAVGAPQAAIDALDDRIRNALNPDADEPGVKRNYRRRFNTAAARFGITFDPSVLP